MNPQYKPWLVIGAGAAALVGLWWWSRSAQAATPGLQLAPVSPGSQGGGTALQQPIPATPVPKAPASGIAPSSITKIEQVEPVVFNSTRKEWQISVNVYQGLNATYKLVFSPATSPPSPTSWTNGLAKLFGVSPSIVSVSGN
jgi:hypothetical protein